MSCVRERGAFDGESPPVLALVVFLVKEENEVAPERHRIPRLRFC